MPSRCKGRYFVDSDNLIPGPDTNSNAEFAGLASASINELSTSETERVIHDHGWLAVEEETTTDITSINWDRYSTNGDTALAATTYPLTSTINVFFTDTGATVHISNDRNDFTHMRLAENRIVKGVGGSSIAATAIGDIKP